MDFTRGRFAPSPSGRMHLGNLFSALLAWLSVRAVGGTLVLRVEDLDPVRCQPAHAWQLMEDLEWLGLTWDEGAVCPPTGRATGGPGTPPPLRRSGPKGWSIPASAPGSSG
ncbi:glutamate--tRNA ligase family protein [Candidatus Pseudoscillospira sp. SGI.172]|uniref:glutamate--tRNA ligase family protein n=1 Tax=Candidatus Pseudoscillospira sp. SGI.172 TaxID=3420582 RepID=UPI003CFDF3B3